MKTYLNIPISIVHINQGRSEIIELANLKKEINVNHIDTKYQIKNFLGDRNVEFIIKKDKFDEVKNKLECIGSHVEYGGLIMSKKGLHLNYINLDCKDFKEQIETIEGRGFKVEINKSLDKHIEFIKEKENHENKRNALQKIFGLNKYISKV
jgi:hypothetical protein